LADDLDAADIRQTNVDEGEIDPGIGPVNEMQCFARSAKRRVAPMRTELRYCTGHRGLEGRVVFDDYREGRVLCLQLFGGALGQEFSV